MIGTLFGNLITQEKEETKQDQENNEEIVSESIQKKDSQSDSEKEPTPAPEVEPEIQEESTQPVPKKKRKRKRKKKNKNQKNQIKIQEQEKRKCIDQFWQTNPNRRIYTYAEHNLRMDDLLRINSKNLNYVKEMQKLFDDQQFSVKQTTQPGWSKKQSNLHRQYMKKFRPKRKYYLVHNDDVKLKLSHRLSMRETRRDPGHKCKFFVFDAAGKLANLAETYQQVKNTHDIGSTMDFLHSNPYFPEALYDLGEYQRLQGNFQQANLLLEKMLFFYEDSLEFAFRLFESNIEPVCPGKPHQIPSPRPSVQRLPS